MSSVHLHDELAQTHDRVVVKTRFGPVTGGRSRNGAAVFLGKGISIVHRDRTRPDWDDQKYPMLFHLKDLRIQSLSLRSFATRTETTSQRVLVSPDSPIYSNLSRHWR